MKEQLLEILECPFCGAKMRACAERRDEREIRRGWLTCLSDKCHQFAIRDGIVHLRTGLGHLTVKKELAYENSTYVGSPRLRDPEIISRFPDSLAELWPHTMHFGPDFRALMQCLDVKPSDWVLDIGTGPCWTSRLLAEQGARVIALDVNDAEFYGLRTSDILFAAHQVYFERVLESMTCLSFAEGSISRVTFNASLHHTPNLRQTLRECRRVLKPGGFVAMANEEFGSLRQRLFRNGPITDEGSHHRVPYSELENEAKAAGFEVQYYVAEHVRRQLERRLTAPAGRLAVKLFESAPALLKQLNSALVILTTTPRRSEEKDKIPVLGMAYD